MTQPNKALESDLPELPEHLVAIDQSDDEFWGELQEHAWDSDYADELKLHAPLFTAGQVRSYALAAIEANASSKREVSAAQAQIPEGFVLIPKEQMKREVLASIVRSRGYATWGQAYEIADDLLTIVQAAPSSAESTKKGGE